MMARVSEGFKGLSTDKLGKERAQRYRQKQLDAGRKQFAFWLTPEENELLKKTLAEYRAGNRPLSFE